VTHLFTERLSSTERGDNSQRLVVDSRICKQVLIGGTRIAGGLVLGLGS
jgi:hypothetical protein